MNHVSIQNKLDIINLYNNYSQTKDIANIYNISIGKLRYWLKHQPETNWRGKNRIYVNQHYFDNIDTQEKAYIIGFISADGSIGDNKRPGITIEIQYRDRELLEKIKLEMEYKGMIRESIKITKTNKTRKYVRLRICNKNLANKLISYGICCRKTYNFSLPTCINENNINHFIRGFFDGDGCLYVNDKICKYAITLVCEKSFSQQMQMLLQKYLNINSRIGKDKKTDVIKTVFIESAVNIEKFLDWIYKNSNIKLERKYEKFITFKKLKEDGKILTKRALLPIEVRKVKTLLQSDMSENKISKQFGVSRSVIHGIKINKTYTDIHN